MLTTVLWPSPQDVPREALFTGQAVALPALMDSKTELNTTKDKLNDKDISVWGKHTGFTNLAGDVVRCAVHTLPVAAAACPPSRQAAPALTPQGPA